MKLMNMKLIQPKIKLPTRADFETILDMSNTEVLDHLVHKYGIGMVQKFAAAMVGAVDAVGSSPSGMLQTQDLIETVAGTNLTIDGQDVNTIWNQMKRELAVFNTMANEVIALLTFPVDKAQEKVGVPTSPGFQKATELGRPTKIRVKYVSRGFPIEHYDLGDGYTQEFIDSAKAAQLLAIQATMFASFNELQKNVVLDALFKSANATDEDGVSVKRLYNADGEVPPRFQRWTHDGTHTHYLSSAGATFTQADIETMEEHLTHHGFGRGGSVFYLHAHRTEVKVIRTFADFVPAASGDRPVIVDGTVVGPTRTGQTAFPAQGYVGNVVIVEDNEIPEDYLMMMATSGTFNPTNVVGLRQHENASARGLRLVEGPRQNYPLYDSVYDTYTGAGVGQRGAAVVMEEGVDPYTDPTFG